MSSWIMIAAAAQPAAAQEAVAVQPPAAPERGVIAYPPAFFESFRPTNAMEMVERVPGFAFDPGIGVCGKSGQSVPVGVGQPSLKLTGLTVGGTSL